MSSSAFHTNTTISRRGKRTGPISNPRAVARVPPSPGWCAVSIHGHLNWFPVMALSAHITLSMRFKLNLLDLPLATNPDAEQLSDNSNILSDIQGTFYKGSAPTLKLHASRLPRYPRGKRSAAPIRATKQAFRLTTAPERACDRGMPWPDQTSGPNNAHRVGHPYTVRN